MSIPWWSIVTTGEEIELLKSVIDSGYLNEGDYTKIFEDLISKEFDNFEVITTTSGTAALYMALRALGIGYGNRVAVPNMTFIATASAVKMTGAEVVLMDVNPETITPDNNEYIRVSNLGVDAIIPVHVSGRSAWNESLTEIMKQGKIKVVEDAAEAMGSLDPLSGKKLGTIGNAGIFSFSPNKIITTGQGGAVLTSDSSVCDRLRKLKDQGRPTRGTGGADRHDFEGYNFKFTNLQSAVGIAQFKQFEKRRKHLQQVYSIYSSKIRNCPHQKLLGFNLNKGEFPLWPEITFADKNSAKAKLDNAGISYRDIWIPINQQKYYEDTSNFQYSETISKATLWLPSSFELTSEDLIHVAKTLICEKCK